MLEGDTPLTGHENQIRTHVNAQGKILLSIQASCVIFPDQHTRRHIIRAQQACSRARGKDLRSSDSQISNDIAGSRRPLLPKQTAGMEVVSGEERAGGFSCNAGGTAAHVNSISVNGEDGRTIAIPEGT